MQHYDIAIIGGGLVGASLTLALAQSSRRIALIDARLPQQNDHRLFALHAQSCEFFKRLHLWDSLLPHAEPIHQVHVSHRGHFGAVRLRREDVNLPSLGFVIPAFQVEKALNTALQHTANIEVIRPATLTKLAESAEHLHCTVQLDDSERDFNADIVFGADGTHSTVRQLLQIPSQVTRYEQLALVARVKLKRSHANIAYERFTEEGTIALLPLINQESALIWTGKTAVIESLLNLTDSEFLAKLQASFGYRLGKLVQVGSRYSYPLQMVKAATFHAGRGFLLGNAAHTLHPIAAQGFNLALFEVAAIAKVIQETTGPLPPLAIQKALNETHHQENFSTNLSHRLVQLFAQPSLLTHLAAPIGLFGLDLLPVAKKHFLNRVLGLT